MIGVQTPGVGSQEPAEDPPTDLEFSQHRDQSQSQEDPRVRAEDLAADSNLRMGGSDGQGQDWSLTQGQSLPPPPPRAHHVPQPNERRLCKYFVRGQCWNGTACDFSHNTSQMDMFEDSPVIGSLSDAGRSSPDQSSTEDGVGSYSQHNMYFDADMDSHTFDTRESDLNKLVAQMNKLTPWASQQEGFNSNRVREMGGGYTGPLNCQIYLTFPAHSTFTEDDVRNYFMSYGTVEDVRIPLKEKRNFGFVTFTSPQPVRTILSLDVEHKIKDAVVLVKPYSEKGKAAAKARNVARQSIRSTRVGIEGLQAPPGSIRNVRSSQNLGYAGRDDSMDITGVGSGSYRAQGMHRLPVGFSPSSMESQATIVLLQQQQLQEVKQQLIQQKQKEQFLQQQVKQLQMQLRFHQQQQQQQQQRSKSTWKVDSNPFHSHGAPSAINRASSITSIMRSDDSSPFYTDSLARTLSGNSLGLDKMSDYSAFMEGSRGADNNSSNSHANNLPDSLLEDSLKPPPHLPSEPFGFHSQADFFSQESSQHGNHYNWGHHDYSSSASAGNLFGGKSNQVYGSPFSGASSGSASANLKTTRACNLCFDVSEDLLVLECMHSYCVSCFSKDISNKTNSCPKCKGPLSVVSNPKQDGQQQQQQQQPWRGGEAGGTGYHTTPTGGLPPRW